MFEKPLKFLLALAFVLAAFSCASAQMPDASSASGRPETKADIPDGLKETLAKYRIKNEEKEYQELVQRGEEAAKLGDELKKSLETTQKLSSEDEKKLDRMEKLVKKIREELGAEDDGNDPEDNSKDKPLTLVSAVDSLQEDAANLLTEIKKIGRHSISVVAIESSNALLKLVKFLRFNKN